MKRNLVPWTSMVSCYADDGLEAEAVRTFVRMVETGFCPSEFCFSAMTRACSKMVDQRIGDSVFGFQVKTGCFSFDVCVGYVLIDMFAKGFDDLDNAYNVFDEMPDPNVSSWVDLVNGYVQIGSHDRPTIQLFHGMVNSSGALPNRFTLSIVLEVAQNLMDPDMGKQVHAIAVNLRLSSQSYVGDCLIHMYSKFGHIEDSSKAFESPIDKNEVSYAAIIDAYVRRVDFLRAFDLLRESGEHIEFSISTLLTGPATAGSIRVGLQIYTRTLKSGLDSCLRVVNALVSMYSKYGDVEAGFRVFGLQTGTW